jgi:hypothetical protein
MNTLRLQAWVLGLVGFVELFAFPAAVMPVSWMQAGHEWLGTGPMPTDPVFEAVMRQVSFSYGLHGVGLLLIASDVARYRPLVILSALGYLAFGIVFLFIDTGLGMPALWVVGNNGSAMLVGALLLGLVWAQWRHEMRL